MLTGAARVTDSCPFGSVLESFADIAPYIIAIDESALQNEIGPQYQLLERLCDDEADLHMLTWV